MSRLLHPFTPPAKMDFSTSFQRDLCSPSRTVARSSTAWDRSGTATSASAETLASSTSSSRGSSRSSRPGRRSHLPPARNCSTSRSPRPLEEALDHRPVRRHHPATRGVPPGRTPPLRRSRPPTRSKAMTEPVRREARSSASRDADRQGERQTAWNFTYSITLHAPLAADGPNGLCDRRRRLPSLVTTNRGLRGAGLRGR